MNILITGAAGFIGSHLSKRLSKKHNIIGIDNFNSFYSPALKYRRIKFFIGRNPNIIIYKKDICSKDIETIFKKHDIDIVINLAAYAGVRYSLINPLAYTKTNITGMLNVLEFAKKYRVKKVLYASSSSVNKISSLYGITKYANELIGTLYSDMFKMNIIGLRFYSVYGEWGRPDMALYKFADCITKNEPIKIYGEGDMSRPFLYIDDAINTIEYLVEHKINPQIFNIGGKTSINLKRFVSLIEKAIGKKAKKKYLAMQKGDIRYSICQNNFAKPNVNIKEGIKKFIEWFKK